MTQGVVIIRGSLFRFSLERPKDVVMHDVAQICLKRSLRGLDHNKTTVQTKNLVAGQCLKTFPGSRNNKWALMVLEERFLHSPVFDNRLKPFDVLVHVRFVRSLYRLLLILELPLIVLLHIREVCGSKFPLSFEERFPPSHIQLHLAETPLRTIPHRREGACGPFKMTSWVLE